MHHKYTPCPQQRAILSHERRQHIVNALRTWANRNAWANITAQVKLRELAGQPEDEQ